MTKKRKASPMTATHRANIGAATRARGLAFRNSAVDGVTLADLHAQGAFFSDAAKRMGWSKSVVARWERDTGKRFRRLDAAERSRRQKAMLDTPEARMERAKHILTPEAIEARAEQMRQRWADPEAAAQMVARRVASRKANPAAVEQSRRQIRAMAEARAEGFRAFIADTARWEAAKAKIAEQARERMADPKVREKIGRRVSEYARRKRVEKGLALLDARTITEKQARALIRDMTAEERMIWLMKSDAWAFKKRWKDAGMIDRPSSKRAAA